MLQTFSLTGTGRQIDAAARFFRYESCEAAGADEAIRVIADGNDLGTYLPGDAVRLPVNASRWVLTPVSSSLVLATVRLGIGEVESARLVGTVRVVDEGSTKTELGTQYGGQATLAAQAAACSVVGLRAITKRVAIHSVKIASLTAGEIYLGSFTGPPQAMNYDVAGTCKLIGAGASDHRVFASTIAASNGSPTALEGPGYALVGRAYLAANDNVDFVFSTPIVLRAGYCLVVNGGMFNRQVTANFDYEELP